MSRRLGRCWKGDGLIPAGGRADLTHNPVIRTVYIVQLGQSGPRGPAHGRQLGTFPQHALVVVAHVAADGRHHPLSAARCCRPAVQVLVNVVQSQRHSAAASNSQGREGSATKGRQASSPGYDGTDRLSAGPKGTLLLLQVVGQRPGHGHGPRAAQVPPVAAGPD